MQKSKFASLYQITYFMVVKKSSLTFLFLMKEALFWQKAIRKKLRSTLEFLINVCCIRKADIGKIWILTRKRGRFSTSLLPGASSADTLWLWLPRVKAGCSSRAPDGRGRGSWINALLRSCSRRLNIFCSFAVAACSVALVTAVADIGCEGALFELSIRCKRATRRGRGRGGETAR